MNAAEQLRQLLNSRFVSAPRRDAGDPELQQRLNHARQSLAPPRGRHALPRIAQGVLAFRVQGRQTPYPELKYACYGLARPTDWESRLLLDDRQLCAALLAAVAALKTSQPRAFVACCRALQRSWEIDIAPQVEQLSRDAQQNSQQLAAFLALNQVKSSVC